MKIRKDNNINSAIELMLENGNFQNEPSVGCFWYDTKNNELFGVYSCLAKDVEYYYSKAYDKYVKTGSKLHKDIWKKESYRNKDKRFQTNYTLIPRGRVFEYKDGGFKVMVGDWINNYPNAKELIIDEFDLPNDVEFVIDKHWNIGRGWSEEYLD